MAVTLILLSILGAIFLKGFEEAINVAVSLVGYLSLSQRDHYLRRALACASASPSFRGLEARALHTTWQRVCHDRRFD